MGAQKKEKKGPGYDPEADPYELGEAPVHEVALNAFRIGRYPVTVEEFRRFMEADGYEHEAWWKAGGFGQRTGPDGWEEQRLHPNRPVVGVTWYEAAAWCAWNGGRLPTEAEWERAARGTQGRKYPWGIEAPDEGRAIYDETKIHHATPVGLFPQGMTPEGLHDLAGNVWEWCSDWYAKDYYSKSPQENPPGPDDGEYRTVRGGSWNVGAVALRAAVRSGYVPGDGLGVVGFRCVREVLP
jgi:formylglycine-generating enzyme required for sulfatase activity